MNQRSSFLEFPVPATYYFRHLILLITFRVLWSLVLLLVLLFPAVQLLQTINHNTNTTTAVQSFNINNALYHYLRFPSRLIMNKISNRQATIRIQTGPDECLKGITSIQDIRNKIQQTQALQSAYGDAKLYRRTWLPIQQQQQGQPKQQQQHQCLDSKDSSVPYNPCDAVSKFSVLQFNTLAQGLSAGNNGTTTPFAKSTENCENSIKSVYGGFTNIPHPEIVLDFDLRKWRLVEVLLDHPTDVIAMEEVDQYYGFFQPILDMIGYQGLFVPKPCSPCIPSGWYSDGCALFWKRDVLELVRQESCSFASGNQVYTIATMRHLETDRIMVLAVTHLKAGKGVEMEKIRKGQVKELKDHIGRVVLALASSKEEKGVKKWDEIPVVIMGDFNSDPTEDQSCVWDLLSQEKASCGGGGDDGCVFLSAYPIASTSANTSFFTTWKIRGEKVQKRVIDYIFYKSTTTSGMECCQLLSIPHPDEMEESKLPGLKYPSDHLAIGAVFHILPR